ncbi:hypothetical protein RHGRI_016685 [Rhododendron griersonianum]|uniref:Mitochondrial adenine nucleotide transporter BTL3 n=1 Tax=Rhododendron griersonianum TaxID=479676 RepID=A0AAV6JUZ6_9ERIC|nr:hypothetical protein RHGRI_016685 [Rhododendron griersonianum]
MPELDALLRNSTSFEQPHSRASTDSISLHGVGGLFLENTVSSSIVDVFSVDSSCCRRKPVVFGGLRRRSRVSACEFLSVSSSVSRTEELLRNSTKHFVQDGGKSSKETEEAAVGGGGKKQKVGLRPGRRGAVNTTKHLWSGAVSAMVSRTLVAPLERLKLEYMVRGEQKNLFELIKSIAASQGLRGFWKGNLVNILRTAPFKAINFYCYDSYRKQFLRFSGNEEVTNFERFIAGAASGITASMLCLPLDTIRTKLVAPGGEALGGVVGAFRNVILTEGFFSLYKGLLPSIMSVAPSGAVFYGVYDILKSAYLHSPEGRKRIQYMKEQGQELSALDQLELGPVRTLLHGAISGACAEASTYPFEVLRRQLQLQSKANKLSALATFVKIVERGGIPALYAGLCPSLLQVMVLRLRLVLPSAAISYFVYEFMKIVLKVE